MAEGKNIHIVFPDEGPRPTSEIDDEDREQVNKDRERIYDEEISPIMQQLIAKCREHKMPLFVECEFAKGDFCKTNVAPKEWDAHVGFITLDIITQCFQENGVNVDKYLMWIVKQVAIAGGYGEEEKTRIE